MNLYKASRILFTLHLRHLYLVKGTALIFQLEGVTGEQLPAKLPQKTRGAGRERESGEALAVE